MSTKKISSRKDGGMATFTGRMTPSVLAFFLLCGCLILLYHARLTVSGAPLLFETGVKVAGLLVVLIAFVVIRRVLVAVNALEAHVGSASAKTGQMKLYTGASFGPVAALADAFNAMIESDEWQRRQINEAREVYRTVVSFSEQAVVWFRPDGRVRFVTPSIMLICGASADEILAGSAELSANLCDDSQSEWQRIVVLGNDSHHAAGQVRVRFESGSLKYVELKCDSVYGDSGDFIGTRLSLRDATPLVEAREQFMAEIDSLSKAALVSQRESESAHSATMRQIAATMRPVLDELTGKLRESSVAMLSAEAANCSTGRLEQLLHESASAARRLAGVINAVDALAVGITAADGHFELSRLLETIGITQFSGQHDWYNFADKPFDAGLRGDLKQIVTALTAVCGAVEQAGVPGRFTVAAGQSGVELSVALPSGYTAGLLTVEYAKLVIEANRGLLIETAARIRIVLSF